MHPRIVCHDDHQPRVDACIGRCKQRIGCDVQADVLHAAHRPRTRYRRSNCHLHGNLFIRRPFTENILIFRNIFRNFRTGRTRIRRNDADAGLPRSARDSFVSQKQLLHSITSINLMCVFTDFSSRVRAVPCRSHSAPAIWALRA